jgi:hypothetical protein
MAAALMSQRIHVVVDSDATIDVCETRCSM